MGGGGKETIAPKGPGSVKGNFGVIFGLAYAKHLPFLLPKSFVHDASALAMSFFSRSPSLSLLLHELQEK